MKVFTKWDTVFTNTGRMYLPMVDGKAGRPTSDLFKAKTQAEHMVTVAMLEKKQAVNMTIVIYDTTIFGLQENCDWISEADSRKEERERAQYERLKKKFGGEQP